MKQDKLDLGMRSRTEKRKIGDLGENIACRFLVKQGFTILNRNYLKKCGEIDIVGQKDNIIHFIEVKTVSYMPISRETDTYRPEDNVHLWKLSRLSRVIQVYLGECESRQNVSHETNWQFDLIIVYLDLKMRRQKVCLMPDLSLN